MVIRGKEFFVPEHYPKDASVKLDYDKKLIEELDTKTTGVLCNMCVQTVQAQSSLCTTHVQR